MNTTTAKGHMRTAFAALNDKQRGNLRWHAEAAAAVLCGKYSHLFTSSGAIGYPEDPPPGGD